MKRAVRVVAEILVAFLLLLAINENWIRKEPRALGPADSVELSGFVLGKVPPKGGWRM